VITYLQKLKTTKAKKAKKYQKDSRLHSGFLSFFASEPLVRCAFAVNFPVMLFSVFLWVKFSTSTRRSSMRITSQQADKEAACAAIRKGDTPVVKV
jgi:hypothetical protein